MLKAYCSNCGRALGDSHYECLDNYLLANYFDGEFDHMFCSEDCALEALSISLIYDDEDEDGELEKGTIWDEDLYVDEDDE